MAYRTNKNITFLCTYHVVWCPKYRRPVLDDEVANSLKEIIRDVCAKTKSDLIELEVMPDHVHILVGCDPQYGIHKLIKLIKGTSSNLIRKEFKRVKSRLPSLWTNSYFCTTTGGASIEQVKMYIENQKHV